MAIAGGIPARTHPSDADSRREWLARSALFRELPEDILRELADAAGERLLENGESLFFKHDCEDFVAVVVSGLIYTVLYGPEGQELIVEAVKPGETLGETALVGRFRHSATAIAHGPTRVLLVMRKQFPLLLSAPDFMVAVLGVLGRRLCQTAERLETMCLYRLESRLARHLLSGAGEDMSSPGMQVALPPNQSILAAMVNASRPKLNAQLQAWRRTGLVTPERNLLRIHDIEALRRKAFQGCS